MAVKAHKFLKRFQEALDLAQRVGLLTDKPEQFIPRVKKTWAKGIGQLAFKEEAAGKLRAFALVDIWTQSLFKPLHEALFDLLRIIPNDGTFNQDLSVKRSAGKAERSGCAYSFDLSAATDRLPIKLQEALLNRFFGLGLGTL